MIYNVERIKRDVRRVIDENYSSERLIADEDVDTLSLDEIIVAKLLDAVRRVHSEAPQYLLEAGHQLDDAVYWDNQYSGHILLPADFMRLVVFRMSDWERPVYNAIAVTDGQYKLQWSRYKGLRGNVQRPVCAVVSRPEGRVLEFWSCNSDEAYVAQGNYIPYPSIDEDGGVDISERCYESVLYATAALTLYAYGDKDKGLSMEELSKGALI